MSEETYATYGIIIRRRDFRENDSRILLYTRDHGLLDLAVRGTKKSGSKLRGQIEPVSVVNAMVIAGRRHDYAGSLQQTEVFLGIKNDYGVSQAAGSALNFFAARCKPGVVDPGAYDLLLGYLQLLNSPAGRNLELWPYWFLLALSAHLGYRPAVAACGQCGKALPAGFSFDWKQLAASCPDCSRTQADWLRADAEAQQSIELAISFDFKKLFNISQINPISAQSVRDFALGLVAYADI